VGNTVRGREQTPDARGICLWRFFVFREGVLSSVILIAVVLIVLALLFVGLKNRLPAPSSASTPELKYESCGELFTPAERSFYGVLRQALDDSFIVFGKVRLGDVVQPVKGLGRSQSQTARNKINRKHLDFVICRADDLSLVAGVELDDNSHQRKDRGERDVFVEEAMKSAGIPLVRFAAKKGYELAEVKTRLTESVLLNTVFADTATQSDPPASPPTPEPVQTLKEVAVPAPSETPVICPACQAGMVKRQAKKGPNEGKWFWACSTFPKCRKAIPIGN